jgi:opacity protein-like surface antigen
MKTKIFFIAGLTAMLFTCQNLQAQIKYGVHAAANLETQAELGQLWNNVDLYQGFLAGGFLEYRLGNKLSFQTELNYQKKGAKFTSTLNGTESVEKKEFNYITLPILIKSNIHDVNLGENWDLSLFTGPYIGYLTSANAKIKTGNFTTPVNIDSRAEKADWGLIFGGGVSYKLANGGAIIGELRYQMGLTEIDKNDPDIRNKGMGITIGYRF